MTDVFHEGDQRRYSRFEQAFGEDLRGEFGIMHLSARFAPIGIGTVLFVGYHDLFDLGLLNHAGGLIFDPCNVLGATVRTARGLMLMDVGDRFGRIRRAGVFRVARLPADLLALAIRPLRFLVVFRLGASAY